MAAPHESRNRWSESRSHSTSSAVVGTRPSRHRPTAWTLEHLDTWYGQTYSSTKVRRNYPARERPVGTGWLKSDRESVRLVGVDALAETRSGWALPRMLQALDDPFLVNRQFASRSLESWLGLSLADIGHRFHTSSEQRQPGIR